MRSFFNRIRDAIGKHGNFLTMVNKCKLKVRLALLRQLYRGTIRGERDSRSGRKKTGMTTQNFSLVNLLGMWKTE